MYMQSWKQNIESSSYLTHYCSIKNVFQCESYINKLNNRQLIRSMCKFRISLHDFRVNHQRKKNVNVSDIDSICLHCDHNAVENEYHVFCICNRYSLLRNEYFKSIN